MYRNEHQLQKPHRRSNSLQVTNALIYLLADCFLFNVMSSCVICVALINQVNEWCIKLVDMFVYWKLATENRPLVASSLIWAADCSAETRSLSVDWILRRRHYITAAPHCCCVQRRVVLWVRCKTIVLASRAWLESFCQWGHVVVAVHGSAVECYDCHGQQPTRALRCRSTSDEATWHQWMNEAQNHWCPLHSPTYM